ncbi:MAG: serine hydrolase [Saprospiraceae bacterium]|nr:serine hydrolase [Saprospiraceae bacterium]
MIKKILLVLLVLLIIGFFAFRSTIGPQLPIVSGYAAKKMCSCTFISERGQESIQNEDLGISPLNLTNTEIDFENKKVTTSIFGMAERTAEYRGRLGCVLLKGKDDYNIQLDIPKVKLNPSAYWPYGPREIRDAVEGVDYEALDIAIKNAFDPSMNIDSIRTRAVVVIYKDTLVGELYANGYGEETELLGWSMTKSVTSALIGILSKEGRLSINDKNLFPHWDDGRANITINDLLQMQSGLKFDEVYDEISDATTMLFMSEDIVSTASYQPLLHKPGTHWSYSSGTSNIISGLIRTKFEKHEDYLKFPHEALFNKIGMQSAHLEIDESGNYIGSSYCYATPRDWAKFGMLYLNDGIWGNERILPEGWVDYSRKAAENSDGIYGGHFWQNHNRVAYPDVPEDLYSCNGHEGQFVFIIPSYDAVIVRMGLSESFDINNFLKEVLDALEPL